MAYKKLHVIAATAVTALFAGCTVGPDFKKPATTMPSHWVSPTTAPAFSGPTTQPFTAELTNWWAIFKDPTLNTLIERAVIGNLDLQQAEARVRQARATVGISESGLWPDVSANASYSRSRAPTPQGGVQQNVYRAGFDATWEIDVFGGTRRAIESSQALAAASVESRRGVLVSLLGDVATNYIQVRNLQERLVIARENLDSQTKTLDLVTRQFKGGQVSRLDVSNAQAQVASTSAALPSLEAGIRTAMYNLDLLLGLQPGELNSLLESSGKTPAVPPAVPMGLPSELLLRRPDIRTAENNWHATTADIGVATADLYPKFSLTGTLGLVGNTPGSLGNLANHFWSISPAASWEIFSGGRVQSNIALQKARRDEAFLAYKSAILTALHDVEIALESYTYEQHRLLALAEAVSANRSSVELARLLYTQGQVDFLNVLAAQNALLSSEDAYQQSMQALDLDLVQLYKALGGGWEPYETQVAKATTQPTQIP
jgi:NodT family efflux transporter outer membrane factor (OMF) lipoprotein